MSNDRVQELIDFINGKVEFMDTQEQERFFRDMLAIAEHQLAHIKYRNAPVDFYINKELQETNHEDKCLKCEVPIVDGGSWGYCAPCFNEEADAYINKKLQETNHE